MKYKKKPVVIDAWRWNGTPWHAHDGDPEVPGWIRRAGLMIFDDPEKGGYGMSVSTPSGAVTARPGDYIIRGIKGEIYPCKPDIFKATYEAVEEDDYELRLADRLVATIHPAAAMISIEEGVDAADLAHVLYAMLVAGPGEFTVLQKIPVVRP